MKYKHNKHLGVIRHAWHFYYALVLVVCGDSGISCLTP
ncbi:DUF3265 domain-containing protein [Vibrio sp. L5-1]|nr:DUF3265 domain-containing protein [Vibrio sp. L5-1]MCF7495222.1 DUF3265 domain-containing protein [Vibrio sp. L5-1]